MKNGIDKLLSSEKATFEQQRFRQRKITRILAACMLPILLGIGVISFLTLLKALSRQTFVAVSASILAYSLLSGLVEYIKTKTNGQKRALFWIIQSFLFVLVSIVIITLLKY
jgi:hypothetical protein